MKILAIETSCDETGITILSQKNEQAGAQTISLLGNALASQIALHAQYGGVFPAMAKRAHAEKIIPLIREALGQADMLVVINNEKLGTESIDTDTLRQTIASLCDKEQELIEPFVTFFQTYEKPDIQYIAVTVGPGLEPALWVGVNTAKVLSVVWGIPVIPINHMEGHVVTAALEAHDKEYTLREIEFPILALLVSGGHTELVIAHAYGQYEKIGQTRDDAVGEAFDKVARMLGLPYPGGPAVSKLAATYRALQLENISGEASTEPLPTITLPRPMLHSKDFDFSYSGIKTATLYTIRDMTSGNTRELTEGEKMTLAAAFEDAAAEVLIKKTILAAKEYHTGTIVVGGGVAGNGYLRAQLALAVEKKLPGVTLLFPEPWLATDNAVMIGMAAMARIQNGSMHTQPAESLKADGNLSLSTVQ